MKKQVGQGTLFGQGIISGVLTVFLVSMIWQAGFTGSVMCSIFLGIFPGGFAGLIGGIIFEKHKWAAYISGVIVGLIEIPLYPYFMLQ